MWYPASIVMPPEDEPITLASAKLFCRVDHDDEDDLIRGLIASARAECEKICGSRLGRQTISIKCDGFGDFERLPEAPIGPVSQIAYIDAAGDAQTLDGSIYELRQDGLEASIVLKPSQRWPAIQPGSRVTLTAVSGYECPPENMLLAMRLMIESTYARDLAAIERGRGIALSLVTNDRRYA